MKNFTTLFVSVCVLFFQYTYAQIQSHYVYGDSLSGCQNSISGYIQNGPLAENVDVYINWGDGNTDMIPVPINSNSLNDFFQNHTYTIGGIYNVDVQFYSNVNASYFGTGEQLTVYANNQNACGYFYGYVYQTSPSISHPDAPLDCVGADGTTTTITMGNSNPNGSIMGYTGLNPSNAPYTVSVNDAWLLTNGYVQVSADQTINSFNADGMADNAQMTFLITCSVPAANPDFTINYMWPSNFVAPMQAGNLMLNICNIACSDTSDVTVSIDFPAGFTPNTTGLTNPSVSGNTLTFDILQLSTCQSLTIPFTFPGATPAGTQICFDGTVSNPNDSDNSNDSLTTCGVVLNSYDPNAKEVDHPAQIDVATDETLQYIIHFQNDGNYNAVNVKLIDTLSTNLDLSTFKLVGAKHNVAYHIDPATRIVEFTFNQIYLQPSSNDLDASQGFVIYEIEENTGLALNSEIENTAYIYFDFNPAIITNTTYNVNTSLGNSELMKEAITVYPNPASTSIQIVGTDLEEIRVFDMLGKEVLTAKLTNTNSVDVENLSNGIYNTVIITKTGTYQQKLTIKK